MAKKKLGQLAAGRRRAAAPKPKKAGAPKVRKARFTWSAGDVEIGDSDAGPTSR